MLLAFEDVYHEHYLTLGLGFFHTLIKAFHEVQMRMLRENSGLSWSWLSSTLEEEPRDMDNLMDDARPSETTLEFQRDSDKDCPNAAWTWSTGHETKIYYYHPYKEGLRQWGYVMWDKERLDGWAILQEDPYDYHHLGLRKRPKRADV